MQDADGYTLWEKEHVDQLRAALAPPGGGIAP